jgi:CrcB protein
MGAIPGALLRWQLRNDVVSNLIGCLVLGAITARQPPAPRLMLLGGIGFSGSLTTFSAWMLQLARLLQASGPLVALGTAIGHLAAGVGLVVVGGVIARFLRRLPWRGLRFRR